MATWNRTLSDYDQRLGQLKSQYLSVREDQKLNEVFKRIQEGEEELEALRRTEKIISALLPIEEAAFGLAEFFGKDSEKCIRVLGDLIEMVPKLAWCLELERRANELVVYYKDALMKQVMDEFATAANASKWPLKIEPDRWDQEDVVGFAKASSNLVQLKELLGDDGPRSLARIMIAPIGIRFQFNFETADSTSPEAGRPEWFLQFLERIIAEHAEFLMDYMQEMIPIKTSLLDVFIRELLGLAKNKLIKMKPSLSDNILMLSHTVVSISKTYASLKETYGFEDEEQACLAFFFSDETLMESWLSAEKEALMTNFKQSQIIPFDQFISDTKDLFDSITELYRFIDDPGIKARFFCTVQVGLLEQFYQSIEFSLPVFHSTSEDTNLFISAVNALDKFIEMVHGDWVQSVIFIELASSPACHRLIGYDPSNLPAHIFNKILVAFQDLHDKIIADHLAGYIMNQFISHASVFAKSMHYGITREPADQAIDLHPSFSKSVMALSEAMALIKSHKLLPHLERNLEAILIGRLADYMFYKVILKNYFHQSGMVAFMRDFSWFLQQLSTIFTSATSLDQSFTKSTESIKLMSITRQQYDSLIHMQEHPRILITLRQLGLQHLGIKEAVELLKLLKFQ